ncbi:vacuolar membrane protein-domain-containing protein [Chiua virens]|nr:vacuolar membrane protein-domain-containing protein [Chiua virens]
MIPIARIIDKGLDVLPLDRQSCQLLGPTALIVQALMGVLAVLSLVYKRHRETQKRPWNIWLFDVSKQVLGQMFVHGLNVLISDLGSHQLAGNACTYYFLNVLLDTTPGIGLIYLALQGSTWLLSKKLSIKGLKTGQYGNPPSVTYWVRQTAVYVFSITTMKLLVVALFAVWPRISSMGDWLLSWANGESIQVIFVMGIFPIFMNILQFWVIDSIVKASTTAPATYSVSPRNSDCPDHEPLFNSRDDDDDASPQDIERYPRSATSVTASEGDIKTLVGAEDNKPNSPASGSSSPMALSRTPVVVHDYPPNGSAGSASSQGSARSRHKCRRSPSSLIDLPVTYSAPAVNSTRNSSRQALLSKLPDYDEAVGDAGEFEGWEEKDWVERVDSGRRSGQNMMHISLTR